jgi:hypothetical protein
VAEQMRMRAGSRRPSVPQSQESTQARRESIPIPIGVRTRPSPAGSPKPSSPSSQHSPNPRPSPAPFSQPRTPPQPSHISEQHQSAISIEPTQAAHAAASSIQRVWRTHRALARLADVRQRFLETSASFVAPDTLDYTLRDMRATKDGREEVAEVHTACVPLADFKVEGLGTSEESSGEGTEDEEVEKTPPLAYTKHTFPVHALGEQYMRLLNELDAVPSWGDRAVRARRRALAREIEREAARVEAWWRAVWRRGREGAAVRSA